MVCRLCGARGSGYGFEKLVMRRQSPSWKHTWWLIGCAHTILRLKHKTECPAVKMYDDIVVVL